MAKSKFMPVPPPISGASFDFRGCLDYNSIMVKIAFSGIPVTGKTSILAEVRKILTLKFRVDEADDVAPANPFDMDQKAGFAAQFYFLTTQINKENIRAMNHPDILLCDRSILDQWVYWKKGVARREANDRLEEETELLRTIYQFWVRSYSLIFHVRVDPKILKARKEQEHDPTLNLKEMQAMEGMFLETIARDRLKAIDIWNHQSVDESAQEVIDKLADLKLI
jgi:hypothetical protein